MRIWGWKLEGIIGKLHVTLKSPHSTGRKGCFPLGHDSLWVKVMNDVLFSVIWTKSISDRQTSRRTALRAFTLWAL